MENRLEENTRWLELQNDVLSYLLEYKKEKPEFTFATRVNDRAGRLTKGNWFQGRDEEGKDRYFFVPLYKPGSSTNKTKTIGFVYGLKKNGEVSHYIKIVGDDGVIDQNEKQTYIEIVDWLSAQNSLLERKELSKKDGFLYAFQFKNSSDWRSNLNFYIKDFKNKCDEVIVSHKLKDKFFITDEDFMQNIEKIESIKSNPKDEESEYGQKRETMSSQPLNQILYGPPGTGKTYSTINKALEIIDGKAPDKREEAKRRFDELKNAGQIVFTTFHQSYGYEEFVEGIKAIPTGKDGNEDGEEMIYDVVDGVFKKLSKLALENFILQATKTAINKKRFTLNAESLNIQAELVEDDENTYRVLKGSKIRKAIVPSFHKYNYSELRNKFFKNAKFDSKKETDEFYILEEDYVFQSLSASSSLILGRMSNGKSDWKEVFNNENLSFSLDEKKETTNYILIIDEINRGNISKIFGELITLIEPSKRIGADEEIRVKLPYSGDEFGVPQNIYIIGTMNTADRSIALMDTALRRRFHFEEMMPDYEVLKELVVDGVKVDDMLQKINERIEYLYDRDHQIGHAYFMSLLKATSGEEAEAELDNIFRNKIIPLLQEYFYDDWEKIQMALGDHPEQKAEDGDKFIKSTPSKEKVIFGFDYNDITDEKMKYEINKIFSSKAYAKIYS